MAASGVAVVTGASAGIGRAIAAELLGRGVDVAAVARTPDRLDDAVADISSASDAGQGARIVAIAGDVSQAADCRRIVDDARAALGPVSILVNNAGGSSAHPFLETDDDTWYDDLDLKLHAAVRLIRAVVPDMRDGNGGSIVNILNTAAKAPRARSTPTSVSRAAGLALTKALANEYAGDRIRVNAVMIGLVKSAQWERRWRSGSGAGAGQSLDEFYEAMGSRVPIGRIAEAHEAAQLVGFLVSDQASYITGTSINFDGGLSPVV